MKVEQYTEFFFLTDWGLGFLYRNSKAILNFIF